MNPNSEIYRAYVQTLKEELIPAMGCTEPIAIAYAAAKAREVLGCAPDMVKIGVSNNKIFTHRMSSNSLYKETLPGAITSDKKTKRSSSICN